MEHKICCLTGHRPKGFPWDYRNVDGDEHQEYLYILQKKVIDLIENHGFTHFISGMAIGADTDFASICLDLRDSRFPHITVEGAIPCPNQDARWTPNDKETYRELLKRLDTTTQVSPRYSYDCFQKRNEYMVDAADQVIAVWNGEKRGGTFNAICYAKKKQKPVYFIFLNGVRVEI
ncbi:MAG: SLOG family protein [Roseburia sp.]|nr:SLOG family protein [Roseburia sp.]